MNNKIFIFLAGLPASGKDTASKYFQSLTYFSISYSHYILKPILNDTQNYLPKILKQTIPNINEKQLKKIITDIETLKSKETGRDLYITLGGIYLPKIIKKLSNNKYSHFNLFAINEYEKNNRIIFAGFRMIEEIDTIKTLYPNAKIITILLKTEDEIRYQRIKQRDKLDKSIIIKNEIHEKETTYNKLISKIKFDYTIENNKTELELITKLKKIKI